MKGVININHLINRTLSFIYTCIFILIGKLSSDGRYICKDSLYICDIPNAEHLKARID